MTLSRPENTEGWEFSLYKDRPAGDMPFIAMNYVGVGLGVQTTHNVDMNSGDILKMYKIFTDAEITVCVDCNKNVEIFVSYGGGCLAFQSLQEVRETIEYGHDDDRDWLDAGLELLSDFGLSSLTKSCAKF